VRRRQSGTNGNGGVAASEPVGAAAVAMAGASTRGDDRTAKRVRISVEMADDRGGVGAREGEQARRKT